MRKQKVIFLSYSFMGYEKEVIGLLEEVMGFEVYFINSKEYEYEYKNIFEKIKNNIFYKPLYKKNLKELMFDKIIKEEIDNIGEVDYYFCIRADKFSHEIFNYIKSKKKPMILHHWDSFSFIEKQKEFLKYFDYKSSFDKKEAKEYDMRFIPNFYLKENILKSKEIEYDFFTVMKYDKRFELLENLAKHLKAKNKKYKFLVITKEDIKSDYITIEKDYIPLVKNYEYLSRSKGIVEIGHTKDMNEKYQGGASFRIADAIGNKKKIITNYDFIKDYDIYNKENICVISKNRIELAEEFLESEYQEYSNEFYEEYSGEGWIRKIFEGIKV